MASTPLIAADLELTGLDVKQHRIIAIGWTLIDKGRIRLGSSKHLLIRSEQSVGTSAGIHELLDSDIARGTTIDTALQALFAAASGRIWVFHHALLDVAFLRRACRQWCGIAPPFVVLDTMHIEMRQRKRREIPIRNGDLKLGRLRSEYNLPRYAAHNAAVDAFATAELLLVQASRLAPDAPLRLGPHLSYL